MTYSDSPSSEINDLIQLAETIALFLRGKQHQDGFWLGPDKRPSLGYTCHALEALALVGSGAFSRIVEEGVYWLLNLADENGIGERINPLHPSRFKTLARLGKFKVEILGQEFKELQRHIDGNGLLQRVLEDQLLGSMIFMDCLLELQNSGSISGFIDTHQSSEIADRTLRAISLALQQWQRRTPHLPFAESIDNLGEASYALDILLRSRNLSKDSEVAQHVFGEMVNALNSDNPQRLFQRDAIYSAIQLCNHFADQPQAIGAVRRLCEQMSAHFHRVNDVATWMKTEEMNALVLRLLLTYEDGAVAQNLTSQVWEELYQSHRQRHRQQAVERANLFERLIRGRVKIDIQHVDELTGGITTAKVFRVKYSIQDNLSSEAPCSDVSSIVIKRGELPMLNRAVTQFRELSHFHVQSYFARHASEPVEVEGADSSATMIVLEDLGEHYVTFREILNDKRHLSPENRTRLQRAMQVIIKCLFDIYVRTSRRIDESSGLSQVARLYLARLNRSLLDMEKRHPKLRNFLAGFTLERESANPIRFNSMAYYQRILYRHVDQLRPPSSMLTHGDCHSRNIMLDRELKSMKFIDLDRIDFTGDFVIDLALLIEDIALFPQFFDEKHFLALRPEQIRLTFAGGQGNVASNSIRFTVDVSEAGRMLQELLLNETDKFVAGFNDARYRARLWLAIALHLLRLVDKQANLNLAAALYVEAVKLLEVLVQYLQGKRTFLPSIPFEPIDRIFAETVPAALRPFHETIIGHSTPETRQIRHEFRAGGRVIRYFYQEDNRPFLILDGSGAHLRLMLSCAAEELLRIGIAAESIREGVLRSALKFDPTDTHVNALLTDILNLVLS